MGFAMLRNVLILALAASLALSALPTRAAEPPMEVRWDQLVPPATPKQLRTFVGPKGAPSTGATGAFDLGAVPSDGMAPPPPKPEGRWLGEKTQSAVAAPVVAALDGKRVQIGGYVVPLDFDATTVKEFLLVPFVGACIHVPPPPANQIIYVKSALGFEVKGQFDPVYVTGKLTTTPASTGLADTGYSIEAEKVEPRAK